MPNNLADIDFLYHNGQTFEEMKKLKSLRPFSAEVCEFLHHFSQKIMADKEAKGYPDIITFGFFCRKSNIEKLMDHYKDTIQSRLGVGLTFHIAPSNVPINFAYTLVVGLLSGNACIVRASSKGFIQTDILCRILHEVLDQSSDEIKNYISIITYDRNNDSTTYLSSICDARIIWGGDNTIKEIRKAPLAARSFDIAFADRYSICVIEAVEYFKNENKNKTAQDFYNDTYLYDQNACSSPRIIIWIGEQDNIISAKKIFWRNLHDNIIAKYVLPSVVAVDKRLTECRFAIDFENTHIEKMPDNFISRIHVNELYANLDEYRCVGGSFIEYDDTNLDALAEIISKKYQTLAYFGFDPNILQQWVIDNGLSGIDRIVPIGKTADFGLVWDGYDLISNLSRICFIE